MANEAKRGGSIENAGTTTKKIKTLPMMERDYGTGKLVTREVPYDGEVPREAMVGVNAIFRKRAGEGRYVPLDEMEAYSFITGKVFKKAGAMPVLKTAKASTYLVSVAKLASLHFECREVARARAEYREREKLTSGGATGDNKRTTTRGGVTRRVMTREEVERNFARSSGVGIVCGAVSGNLELLDFDDGGSRFEPWLEKVPRELRERLVVESTPSGGRHVYYRVKGAAGERYVPGNRKLAMKADGHVLIETRGEAGYVKCAPSEGYRVIRGSLHDVKELTPMEEQMLIDAAVALDESGAREGEEGDGDNKRTTTRWRRRGRDNKRTTTRRGRRANLDGGRQPLLARRADDYIGENLAAYSGGGVRET